MKDLHYIYSSGVTKNGEIYSVEVKDDDFYLWKIKVTSVNQKSMLASDLATGI